MLTIFLSILFSKQLSFTGLTVTVLLQWLNLHPFIAILAIFDLLLGVLIIGNVLTSMLLTLPEHEHYVMDCDCKDYEEKEVLDQKDRDNLQYFND